MAVWQIFPDHIAMGAQASIAYETQITTLASGHERRNAARHAPKRRYQLNSGVQSRDDLAVLIAFFHAQHGAWGGFLFRDFSDFKSCSPGNQPAADDQFIGMGDGQSLAFPLQKLGQFGGEARRITRPIATSVRVMIEDQVLINGAHFTVDDARGVVQFVDPPEARARIFAGFEFLVPVRFETDILAISLDHFDAGLASDISLIEIFDEVSA